MSSSWLCYVAHIRGLIRYEMMVVIRGYMDYLRMSLPLDNNNPYMREGIYKHYGIIIIRQIQGMYTRYDVYPRNE